MSVRRFAVIMSLLLLVSGGCCRFCDRWCGPHNANVAPAPVYAPAVVPAAAPAQCVPCVPCCPVGQLKPQPVPAFNSQAHANTSWQRTYGQDGSCCN